MQCLFFQENYKCNFMVGIYLICCLEMWIIVEGISNIIHYITQIDCLLGLFTSIDFYIFKKKS